MRKSERQYGDCFRLVRASPSIAFKRLLLDAGQLRQKIHPFFSLITARSGLPVQCARSGVYRPVVSMIGMKIDDAKRTGATLRCCLPAILTLRQQINSWSLVAI